MGSMGILDIGDRRDLIADVIDAVFVRKGIGYPDERVTICARGEAPVGLPQPRHRNRGQSTGP